MKLKYNIMISRGEESSYR